MRRRSAGALGIASFGVVVACFVSCRQIAGINDSPPTALTASVCGLPFGTAACAACISQHCCAESSACATDPPCAEQYQCLGGCGLDDWQCRTQCSTNDSPGLAATYPRLSACAAARCETECDLTCGALGPLLAVGDAGASCQACTTKNCEGSRACASSVDCLSSIQCNRTLGLNAPACSDAGVGAAAIAQEVVPCLTSCGLASNGNDWSCVGHEPSAIGTNGDTTVTFGVAEDYVTSKPLADATVKVCRYEDPSCQNPLAQGESDDAGMDMIYVPQQPSFGGLNVNSYLQATLPGYAPTLLFWGFVATGPQVDTGSYLPLFTVPEAQALFAQQGVTWDTTRGFLGYYVEDCPPSFANSPLGSLAQGVRVTLDVSDQAVREFYGTTFDFTATQTDGSGLGGFVNVPPGAVTVTATPIALGKPSSKRTVLVRAGTFTGFYLLPNL